MDNAINNNISEFFEQSINYWKEKSSLLPFYTVKTLSISMDS